MAQTAEEPTEPVAAPPPPPGTDTASADRPAATTAASDGARRTRVVTRPAVRERRRTRVELRHVGPLTVLKFSLLFSFCVMLITFIALFLIFQVLEAAGTIATLETTILGCLFQEGERATTGECIPYEINGSVVFTWLFLAGVAGTVVISLLNTFIAVVYNLISDIVGGVEVTLAERPRD